MRPVAEWIRLRLDAPRRDKNVVIQTIPIVRDPKTGTLSTVALAEQALALAKASLAQAMSGPVQSGPDFITRIFEPHKARVFDAAQIASHNARAELVAQVKQQQDLLQMGERVNLFRLHSKRHYVDFTEDSYEQNRALQETSPVLATTWDGKRWWWYLDRFWWDSEGLEADDIQALVLQSDRRKRATLDRARTGSVDEAHFKGRGTQRRGGHDDFGA